MGKKSDSKQKVLSSIPLQNTFFFFFFLLIFSKSFFSPTFLPFRRLKLVPPPADQAEMNLADSPDPGLRWNREESTRVPETDVVEGMKVAIPSDFHFFSNCFLSDLWRFSVHPAEVPFQPKELKVLSGLRATLSRSGAQGDSRLLDVERGRRSHRVTFFGFSLSSSFSFQFQFRITFIQSEDFTGLSSCF